MKTPLLQVINIKIFVKSHNQNNLKNKYKYCTMYIQLNKHFCDEQNNLSTV
jgi:hypothetical protein